MRLVDSFISSFGRRHGRSLTPYKKRLVEELLPKLTLNCHPREGGDDKEIRLEIGFGAGEHLAAQAKTYPECLFIGCEPYINGVAKLLAQIDRENITNIRL